MTRSAYVLGAVLAFALGFAPARADQATHGLQALKGDDTCAYGEHGCNVCVPDVREAFARTSGSRKRRHTFRFEQKTPSLNLEKPGHIKIKQHIQGITRIPGLDHENWVALSHSAVRVGDGALYLVRFDFIDSDGRAWKHARRLSDETRSYYYHRIPGTNHSGGMQALGTMLFTANECGAGKKCDAFISVHDVRDPSEIRLVSRLVLDGSQGELGKYESGAAAVAATRLADGRYLLFFRGGQRDENGWFFISDSPGISERTRWIYLQGWHRSELPAGDPWLPWENHNFITECGTGDLYLVGLGTMDDDVKLYRLTQGERLGLPAREGARLGFAHVAGRQLNTGLPFVGPRSGGGVHVTPRGDLVIYVTDRRPDVRIQEFRPRERP